MSMVYFVQDQMGRYLNQHGDWARSRSGYRLLTFPTEAEAIAAFPAGITCRAVRGSAPKPESSEDCTYLVMGPGNKILDANDQWAANTSRDGATFDTFDAALDKVVSLGVSLDRVDVLTRRKSLIA